MRTKEDQVYVAPFGVFPGRRVKTTSSVTTSNHVGCYVVQIVVYVDVGNFYEWMTHSAAEQDLARP